MIKLIIKKLQNGMVEARIKDTNISSQAATTAEAIGRLVEEHGDEVCITYEFNRDPLTESWTGDGQAHNRIDVISPQHIKDDTPRGTTLRSNQLEKILGVVVSVCKQLAMDRWVPFTWEQFQRLNDRHHGHQDHINLDELVAKGVLSYGNGRYQMTDEGIWTLEQAECVMAVRMSG